MDVQESTLGDGDAGLVLDYEGSLDLHPGGGGDDDVVSRLDDDCLLRQEDEVGVDILPDVDGLHGVAEVVGSVSSEVRLDLGGGVEAHSSGIFDRSLCGSLGSDDESTDEHAGSGFDFDFGICGGTIIEDNRRSICHCKCDS